MEPNEIIGVGFLSLAVISLGSGLVFHFTIWNLVLEGVFGVFALTFLSYWGLTTFNDLLK